MTRKLDIYSICQMARPRFGSPQTIRLLAAFLQQADVWRYGYDLSRETRLKSGTLYPLLMRLANEGWLEARWMEPERPGRPPRHAYRLTPTGRMLAMRQVDSKAAGRRPALLGG